MLIHTEMELPFTPAYQSARRTQIVPLNQSSESRVFQPLQTEPTESDEQQEQGVIMEDGKLVKFCFQRLVIVERACMFFALVTITFSIIYYEADNRKTSSTLSVTILWLMFASSIQLILMTILRYNIKLDLQKYQRVVDQDHKLHHYPHIYYITLEIVIILLQPYPQLNEFFFSVQDDYDRIPTYIKVNHLMCIFIMTRLFIILRAIMRSTTYMQPRALRIARLYGFEADYEYCIRCLFRDYPLQAICGMFMFQVFYFGWAIRIAEKPMTHKTQGKGGENLVDLGIYMNCLWTVMNSMTTVGYGDYFPRSVIGRLLTSFIAFWGIFSVSMMMVVLQQTFLLTPLEEKALTVIKCLQGKLDQASNAAYVLTLAFKVKDGSEWGQSSLQRDLERLKYEKKRKQHSLALENITRSIRMLYEKDNFQEQMNRQFQQLRTDIKSLGVNQIILKNYVENNFESVIHKFDQ